MTSFWRIWAISTLICLALILWRLTGDMTPLALGQLVAAAALPIVWGGWGLLRGRAVAAR